MRKTAKTFLHSHKTTAVVGFASILLVTVLTGCDSGSKKSTSPTLATAETSSADETASSETASSKTDSGAKTDDDTAVKSSSASGSRKILCFGDSITLGVGTSEPYPSKLARITGDQVINAGIRSQTSAQGLRRIGGVLSQHKPTHVCLLYGTNDVRVGISSGETGNNIAGMIAAAKASGAKVIVGTLPPLHEHGGTLKGAVDAANERIRSAAGSKGASIANVAGEFGSGAGTINNDGIHPNNSGAAIIAVTFSEKL
ncbi:MAG: acyl-CoA thioesterase-1 [Kiritimatiellia bacterium]|jgi:acyl-CoA thioesterase I